jgi:ubiquinone/menaquinone biosynthesis C-methylase UbiE
LGDAREIPFRPAIFDGVWAYASLLHLQKADVPLALAEAFRILRPGGVLFTSMQHGSGELVPYDPGFGLPQRHYFFYGAGEWATLVRTRWL